MNQEHQELVGYKNALRVFGQGVVADAGIKVIDTLSWSECAKGQVSGCDDECGDHTNSEDCFIQCTNALQCREVPVMDIG